MIQLRHLLLGGFILLAATGCTTVNVYPHQRGDAIQVHHYLGVVWIQPPAGSSGFYIESRGVGVARQIDGFTLGYHDVRAVCGMPTNAVVVFGEGPALPNRIFINHLNITPNEQHP